MISETYLGEATDSEKTLAFKIMEKDKEIESLTELCNKYEEEHKTTFETWQKDIKEIERLQQCIKDDKEHADEIISEQAKEIERLNKDNGDITKLFAKER